MSVDVCGPFDELFSKMKYLIIVFNDFYTKVRYDFLVKEKSSIGARPCRNFDKTSQRWI